MTPRDFYQDPPYSGWSYEGQEALSSPGGNPIYPGPSAYPFAEDMLAQTSPFAAKSPFMSPPPFVPTEPPISKKRAKPNRLALFFSLLALLAIVIGGIAGGGEDLFQRGQLTFSPTAPAKQVNGQRAMNVSFPQSLPQQWIASGHSLADAGDAVVIAQGFTERYASFEASTPQSRSSSAIAATIFLTRNATLRYLGKVPGVPPDPHATGTYLQQVQADFNASMPISSLQAVANGVPQVQSPQQLGGVFTAVVTVPYELIASFSDGTIKIQQNEMAVALVSVQKDGTSVSNTMGWGVTAYAQGTTLPLLPQNP